MTDPARQVVVLAQDDARALRHNYLGTEHLLLGLLRENEGVAALVLTSLGVSAEDVRAQVRQLVGLGEETPAGEIPFTPRAKKVIELGLREATALGDREAGPEHLLLGLLGEGEGAATRILADVGAPPERVRGALVAALTEAPAHGERADDAAERARAEKEAAIEQGDFHRAAVLRSREQKLLRDEGVAPPPSSLPEVRADPSPLTALAMAVGGLLLGLGILIGWAIWG